MSDHRNLLGHARMLVHATGCSVLPIAPGTKIPADRYADATVYLERRPTDIELAAWFGGDDPLELGIVCGPVSGGLVVLDLDHESLWPQLKSMLPWTITQHLPVVRTDRGHHVYFRMDDPPGTTTLAEIPGLLPLATTRGAGGWVVAPPSWHPSGGRYQLVEGNLLTIPYLDARQAGDVLSRARFTWLFENPYPGMTIRLTPAGLALDDQQGGGHTLTFAQAGRLGQYLHTWDALLGRAEFAANPPEPTVDYDSYWRDEEE